MLFFCLFRATPWQYEGSQPRGQIGAVAAGLHHSHSHSHATYTTYTTAHGNTGSRARPGLEPASSWTLVRFVSPEPRRELPNQFPFKFRFLGVLLKHSWQSVSVGVTLTVLTLSLAFVRFFLHRFEENLCF